MAEAPSQSKLQQLPEQQRKRVEQAVKDGLIGRKALMRAYETISERVKDSETKTMLRRFAEDEKKEFDAGKRIVERYGIDTGVAEGVKSEVVAFLGKLMVTTGEGPYADLRDLTMLYGAEMSAKLGAQPMEKFAEMLGDREWKDVVKKSEDRCEDHAEYLKGRVQDLSREAFGVR